MTGDAPIQVQDASMSVGPLIPHARCSLLFLKPRRATDSDAAPATGRHGLMRSWA